MLLDKLRDSVTLKQRKTHCGLITHPLPHVVADADADL